MNLLIKHQKISSPLPSRYILSSMEWEHPSKPGAITFGLSSIEEGLKLIVECIKQDFEKEGKRKFYIEID